MGRRTSRRFLLIAAPIAVLTVRARAQPAPDVRPVGGTVVAGAATIARSPTQTSITQTTQRAAINWQGFDVGSRQNVTFAQPSATAMTLNRVTGPNPSQIAGRITANGQIVLVNPAGVVFYKGAQVNTNGLLVTAAGISDRNFMAGRMVFDQPAQPNAKVENRGEITIRQAGLAALVAPQVANSGVISARLGHVVLAGARTATLDLYGDGLVAIDVTGQVRQVPLGPDGKPVTALVTNTGIVRADGGTVQLTAQAADGIVQTLVEAGGRIQADSAGSRTGTIVLSGLGGAIRISGQLDARGRAPDSAGGRIVADTNGDVLVGSSARIDASGSTGGGMIVLGTTLARAASGPAVASTLTARRTRIDAGAKIAA
ncbi:MAG TPA: filamentous hemagglutinin N-terminal domain-containing protein, partial [Acetobacteraceae bacterium]|nr:filamentous hemagglutinin N-terminal domain-containing protein [Acetobacteraceae bacterium]